MKKKILIVAHNFWPENFPINDFVKVIKRKFEVSILTGKPNYPFGNIFKPYNWYGFINEKYLKDISVYRVPIIPRGSGKNIMKILNYTSFLFSSFFFLPKFFFKKIDHIFIYAPSPVIHALVGIFLKKIIRVKLSIWLQDLLIAPLVLKKKKFLILFLDIILKYIYRESDIVFVQSKKYFKYFKNIIPKKKLVYLPNLLIKNNIKPSFSKTYNLNFKKFNIGYFGNVGEVQEFNTIFHSAKLIKNSNINFHIFGEGIKKKDIFNKIKKEKLDNLFLHNHIHYSKVLYLIKKFDVLFLSLKKGDMLNLTAPSKIQLYLSTGKPILGEIDGECKRIILESKSGIIVKNKNIKGMVNAINYLYKIRNTHKFKNYGINGKKYFLKHFNQKEILNIFYANLNKIL